MQACKPPKQRESKTSNTGVTYKVESSGWKLVSTSIEIPEAGVYPSFGCPYLRVQAAEHILHLLRAGSREDALVASLHAQRERMNGNLHRWIARLLPQMRNSGVIPPQP